MRNQINLDRRTFLQRTGLLGAGLTLSSSWLTACSDAPGPEAQVPFTVDPDQPWWLQNNFQPVLREVEAFDLDVEGSLPPELDGLYVRNGSNAQTGTTGHWFLGDGMLHGVRLAGGRALSYRNRWIRTEPFLSGEDPGAPVRGANHSNVSVILHNGRLLTSGEVGAPYEVDPRDLSTVGVEDFQGNLNSSFTAHAKEDPATGWLHFFGYWFGPPYLTYHVADENGHHIVREDIDIPASTMIHSFAITDQDVVFWDLPVLFDPAGLQVSGFPFLWSNDHPARIGIMPLGGSAADLRWVEIPPCYVFHELNAYRDGSDVVIDVCRHARTRDRANRLSTRPLRLHEWRIDTSGPELVFHDRIVEDMGLEFPMFDRRLTGRRHRYGWFAQSIDRDDSADFYGLLFRDYDTGRTRVWTPGPRGHAGEPLFVPAGSGEGEGWILSFVYDDGTQRSRLVVLDPMRIDAGPVATVHLPQRVPYGFHGTWVPGDLL